MRREREQMCSCKENAAGNSIHIGKAFDAARAHPIVLERIENAYSQH